MRTTSDLLQNMLQASSKVFSVPVTNLSKCALSTLTTLYSSCGPTSIKEAPILDNENVMDLPEESRVKKNLETSIMVPTMVDLTPVNGVPDDYLRTRRVRIFQPAKNAMQSGTNNIRHWEMEFDNWQRWENPLMGWTSTGDPLSGLKVRFTTACEAIEHCEKNGWIWFLDVPKTEREFKPKTYDSNFSWNRRSRISTK